jgi:uncharacterized membrane protein
MKRTLKLVLQGLITVLPLLLTAYCVIWLLSFIEEMSKTLLLTVVPEDHYLPGMGIVAGLLVLFLIGLMVNTYGMQYLVRLGNQIMESIPFVKSIYGAIQDIMSVFSLNSKKEMKSVVSVEVAKGMKLIGFITGEQAGQKLYPDQDRVGVYLPMSYQIGGFTVYIERDKITPLDIPIEDAMRIAITGGVQSNNKEHQDEDLITPLAEFIQGHNPMSSASKEPSADKEPSTDQESSKDKETPTDNDLATDKEKNFTEKPKEA